MTTGSMSAGADCPDLCDHAALHHALTQRVAELRLEHEHDWVFLRQEERPAFLGTGRIREWEIFDVFYCRLEPTHPYSVVPLRREEPSSSDYNRRIVTWRAVEARPA